ncbi:hypothetical protein ABIA32_000251 [Streptacidiphilus sp. MAP12-20]|uniref:hypothetical protein n=1 Tax=Streptacidiphilus sp. MAP12-20 TaxID=3156299 RepID=UPI00351420CB
MKLSPASEAEETDRLALTGVIMLAQAALSRQAEASDRELIVRCVRDEAELRDLDLLPRDR